MTAVLDPTMFTVDEIVEALATITWQPEKLDKPATTEPTRPIVPVICFEGDAEPTNEYEKRLLDFYWLFAFEWERLKDRKLAQWWDFLYDQTIRLAELIDEDTTEIFNAYRNRIWVYRRSLHKGKTKVTKAQRAAGMNELLLIQARLVFEYAMVLKAIMKIKQSTRYSRLMEHICTSETIEPMFDKVLNVALTRPLIVVAEILDNVLPIN